MTFHIQNKANAPIGLIKAKVYKKARRTIILYPESVAEKQLNEYFLKLNGLSLKMMCLKILGSGEFMTSSTGDVVVKFTGYYDKLARFITFGDLIHSGSKILETAFGRY